MVISSEVHLLGSDWQIVANEYAQFFKKATYYDLFILATSIGIMYDKRLQIKKKESDEDFKSISRNVLQTRNVEKGAILDLLFQTAILSTKTETLSLEERMDLAFGEETDFNELGFLVEFSNYGATKLLDLIGNTPVETMNNLNMFLVSSLEGTNFEIDNLPDDAFDDFVPEELSDS